MKLELTFHSTICISVTAVCITLGICDKIDIWGILLTVFPTIFTSVFSLLCSYHVRSRQIKFELLLELSHIPKYIDDAVNDIVGCHLASIRSGNPRFITSEAQMKQRIQNTKLQIYKCYETSFENFYKLFKIPKKANLENFKEDFKAAEASLKLSKTERIIFDKSKKQ